MRLDKQVQEWLTRTPGLVEALFDGLPDVLFYVKDDEGRYLWANQTLIDRAGLAGLQAVAGRRRISCSRWPGRARWRRTWR
jgi:hypothetical protein